MESKRLFIALLPDDGVRDALQHTQQELADQVTKARLTARTNLHMTLAFLGSQSEEGEWAARDALKQAADQMSGRGKLRLTLGDVGYFDKRKGGLVFWRGVQKDRSALQLKALREVLRLRLGANGLQVSEAFTPHMTLARGVQLEAKLHSRLYREAEALCSTLSENAPAAVLAPSRVSLMWSHRVNNQLTYTEIGSVTW